MDEAIAICDDSRRKNWMCLILHQEATRAHGWYHNLIIGPRYFGENQVCRVNHINLS